MENSADMYAFERDPMAHRKQEQAIEESKKFLHRFKVGDICKIGSDEMDIITKYVINHHLNICWYQRKKQEELRLHSTYFWYTVGLLVLLPIVMAGAPLLVNLLAKDGAVKNWAIIGGQITALLTGIIAIHKSIGAWLEKRKLGAKFWEAAAGLKTNLYKLEDDFRGKAVDSSGASLTKEFVGALKEGTRTAEELVKAEQQEYFDSLTAPSINSILGDTDLLGWITGTKEKIKYDAALIAALTALREEKKKNESKTSEKSGDQAPEKENPEDKKPAASEQSSAAKLPSEGANLNAADGSKESIAMQQ